MKLGRGWSPRSALRKRHAQAATADAAFPTDSAGLVAAGSAEVRDVADGGTVELRVAPVAKQLGNSKVRMLAYNGSIPGPTLRVQEGSEVVVDVVNEGDLETTVHWHGLRLENRYDGTHETQAPIPVGGRFSYRIRFPDPGVYWYHPHIREDYGQELGLYGNILVVPADSDYWPPAHRELVLTLDDVLLEGDEIAAFSRVETTYVAMGRFGNTLLVAGETELRLGAQVGEVVRLYLTNTANTRVFNVALPGARVKLVGGDSGRCEREAFVESVVIAPSERVVVDVLFDQAGVLTLEHRTPKRTYSLATIEVDAEAATPSLLDEFENLRRNGEWAELRGRIASYVDAPPDKTLALIAEMDLGTPEGPVVYRCPMHTEVVRETPGRCPKCFMKLVAIAATEYVCPMHREVVSGEPGQCPRCGMKLVSAQAIAHAAGGDGGHHAGNGALEEHAVLGHDAHRDAVDRVHPRGNEGHADAGDIEWEDDMVDLNRVTTRGNMRWKLVDRETGAVNHEIAWRFQVGDMVKLRLVNEMDSDHPMHHPFHIHGAGRFVVLSRDGNPEENLVWKDTVLVRTGETVDILLEVTNPGRWMAHCHIAEHHESGMMFTFDVAG